MSAHTPLFAHTYAHPVETHGPAAARYGPHQPSSEPVSVTVLPRKPAGMHEAHEVAAPRALVKQRRQLNTLAYENARQRPVKDSDMAAPTKHAGTAEDPKPVLLGYCGLTNPDASHHSCRGWYMWRDTHYRCSCNRDGCPCAARNKALLQQEGHPCGHAAVTAGCGGCDPGAIDLVVLDDGTQRPYDAALDMAQPAVAGTAWTADEVADLMVELEQCPLCDWTWPEHVFTDDDRVVCP